MKEPYLGRYPLVLLLTTVLAAPGCFVWKWKDSDIALTDVPLDGFGILSLRAYQDNGAFFVKGSVRRNESGYRGVGHVDLIFRDKHGEVVGETSTRYWPQIVQYMRPRDSRFHVIVNTDPGPSGAVTITQHRGPVHSVERLVGTNEFKGLLFGFPICVNSSRTGEIP